MMRKFVLALAVAGSAAAIASPASAQYYPQRHDDRGYNRGYADPSGLQQRIHNVLKSLDGVRPDQRYNLQRGAIQLDRGLRHAARNGLNLREHQEFDHRIYELERYMADARMSDRRRYGYRRY